MNVDSDIFQIFSALDDNNQGYIDKNKFLKTMLEYSASMGDHEQNEIDRIKELIRPYEKIKFQEFKDIYIQINGFDRENNVLTNSTKRIRKSSSSDSSDIDESDKRVFNNKNSFISSPSSARKRGLDLLNKSRASLQKIINEPIKNDSDGTSLCQNSHLAFMSAEDIDGVVSENEKLKNDIEKLRGKLKEEEIRYKNEKDQNKILSERAYQLESQIHDIEIKYKTEIKQINENINIKMENIKVEHKIKESKLEQELVELQNQLNRARDECEQSQSDFKMLLTKNEDIQKDYKLLQYQLSDCENILLDYKKVASHQVTELQTERDQLEIVNKELYIELQTMKHLSMKEPVNNVTIESEEVSLRNRQRVRSAIISPLSLNKPLSSLSIPAESVSSKNNTEAIDNDMNRVVHLLTIENRDLVERIAHLETVGFYQRQKLEAANCISLAEEMERLNIDEMRKALAVERETVKALKSYMENMTTKLLTLGYLDVFQLS